jgi:uncharacterized protein with FMN-binding domain
MTPQPYKPNNMPKIVGAVVSVAVVAAVLMYLIDRSHATETASTDMSASPTVTVDSPAGSVNASPAAGAAVKDGTYTASADYDVPRDTNTIAVTLTVKHGVITAVSEKDSYGERESARYISSFKSAISGLVVGKSLTEARVSRVSGASDTTDGFNDALDNIISQAKA